MTKVGVVKRIYPLSLLILTACGSTDRPVNEDYLLDVGVNELYLEVSGPSTAAPVLLYLHGDPGNVVAGVLTFQADVGRRLEEDFLVAYLHQRGAGKSSPVAPAEQTASAYVRDLEYVVDLLTEKLGRDRVNILGHSRGAILAALYAEANSEDVEKLILMSATVNVLSQFVDSREATLEWAGEEGVAEAIAQLTDVDTSFRAPSDREVLGRWSAQARGGVRPKPGQVVHRENRQQPRIPELATAYRGYRERDD